LVVRPSFKPWLGRSTVLPLSVAVTVKLTAPAASDELAVLLALL
jgi:hypothetical protein